MTVSDVEKGLTPYDNEYVARESGRKSAELFVEQKAAEVHPIFENPSPYTQQRCSQHIGKPDE